MRRATALLIVIMMTSSLAGCFGSEEEEIIIESSPFDFEREIPSTTWYHYSGGINALNKSALIEANITVNLTENNIPYWTQGSYYSIGMSTFEPTIGITSNDNQIASSLGICCFWFGNLQRGNRVRVPFAKKKYCISFLYNVFYWCNNSGYSVFKSV